MTTSQDMDTSKQGVPYYVYYDLDRVMVTELQLQQLESEALMPNKHFCQGPRCHD